MKKSFSWLIILIISVSLASMSIYTGCKAEAAEEAEEVVEEVAEEEVAEGEVPSEEFDWKKYDGEEINLFMVEHPYAQGIIDAIPEFTDLTGITVSVESLSENEFFDKLTILLSAGDTELDVFMSGVMQLWTYAPAGYVEPLDDYINDSIMTNPDYDFEDIFQRLREATQWSMVPGEPVGNGPQLALPIGFEQMALSYRADLFEKYDIDVPETLTDVYEASKIIEENEPDMYGFSCRGIRTWNLCHTAPISLLTNYGGTDFYEDLQPAMGSTEGIAFHKDFVKLIQDYGRPGWVGTEWYDVMGDLASGKAAMTIDADILAYYAQQQEGAVISEPGMINWAPVPTKPGGTDHKANLWVWSIAMNSASDSKGPAWYFMQWATSKEYDERFALDLSRVNPVRESTWENEEFVDSLSAAYPTYVDTFLYTIDYCSVLFTPQAEMVERVTEWAVAIQDMVEGADVEERLEELVEDLTLE
jgi:multiple sugar transport system substrate-binding protein